MIYLEAIHFCQRQSVNEDEANKNNGEKKRKQNEPTVRRGPIFNTT